MGVTIRDLLERCLWKIIFSHCFSVLAGGVETRVATYGIDLNYVIIYV